MEMSVNDNKENVKVNTKKKKNINNIGFLFILPFLIIFIIFSIYPILRTLYLSFTSFNGFTDPQFVGIDNYKRLLTDSIFWNAFGNTLKIWLINIVAQLGLAFLLTIIFSDIKYKIRGLSVFRALFYLPNLIATTSVAFLFAQLLDWQYGTINQMLLDMGVISSKINWLGQPKTAILAVSLIGAWMWFGNSFLMLMAGVQGISKDYYEAAYIDGAGKWKVFTCITLPLLKPIMLYVAITSLIGGLQIFDLPFLITDGIGSPSGALNTTVMYLFNTAFQYNNVGYAAAIAYGLFFIIAVFSALTFKTMYGSKKEAK